MHVVDMVRLPKAELSDLKKMTIVYFLRELEKYTCLLCSKHYFIWFTGSRVLYFSDASLRLVDVFLHLVYVVDSNSLISTAEIFTEYNLMTQMSCK